FLVARPSLEGKADNKAPLTFGGHYADNRISCHRDVARYARGVGAKRRLRKILPRKELCKCDSAGKELLHAKMRGELPDDQEKKKGQVPERGLPLDNVFPARGAASRFVPTATRLS